MRYPNKTLYYKGNKRQHKQEMAFKSRDMAEIRAAQKALNHQLRTARLQHKEQAEQELSSSNTKKLWDSIRGMTNMDTKRKTLFAHNVTERANELNNFYLRFETDSFRECCAVLKDVICNVDEDRTGIDPQSVSAFLLKAFIE